MKDHYEFVKPDTHAVFFCAKHKLIKWKNMIIHLNIKDCDSSLIQSYISNVLKSLYGSVDIELQTQIGQTVTQYHDSLTKITVDMFDQSDMIRSVRLGSVAFVYKKARHVFSEIEAFYSVSHKEKKYVDIHTLGDCHPFFNADVYGQLKNEEIGYQQMKLFLLNKLNERLNAVVDGAEHKSKILEALFWKNEFNGIANPIIFTLDEMKLAHEKFIFEILKSSLLEENIFELACHGVTSDFVKNTNDENPCDVLKNYQTIISKYELTNTDGSNSRFIPALQSWANDNPNKLIFLRDYSKNNFDCLDQNFFALDEIVLKSRYSKTSLDNLQTKQVFSDSGIWRKLLKSCPIHLSKTLKSLNVDNKKSQERLNENLHSDAFLLQFSLKQTLDRFDTAQLKYLIEKPKFSAFMSNIVCVLHPTEYEKANRFFGIVMNTMWVEDGFHYTKIKSIREQFDRSSFSNALDYLNDMKALNFSQRYTVKSLLRNSKQWHNSIEQHKKRVVEFSIPEINYDILHIRFEAICNREQLISEIETMHHCISSYSELMAEHKYIAFRFFDTKSNIRGTVGIRMSGWINGDNIQKSYHYYRFDQISGQNNVQLPSYTRIACESLLGRLMKEQPLVDTLIKEHTLSNHSV